MQDEKLSIGGNTAGVAEFNVQRGMTGIGWLILLALIAFFVLLILRLAPAYLEYAKVASVMDAVVEEPLVTRKTASELHRMIDRRFGINDVKSIKGKDFKIENKGGKLSIEIRYEVRKPMMGNVDVVVRFRKRVEAAGN